ncbi:hypothetical protein GTP44_25045 [Duganella sp. FT50W]|uniref:Uncharacterized protein n=1 Tax=Duganella lactea TaxID=2692173 RepID=A0A6L8MT07_9BURK|nr:hypothetical protein [Duganella lactea]MYM85195.1 hypothetical protein [Duganella lactea]
MLGKSGWARARRRAGSWCSGRSNGGGGWREAPCFRALARAVLNWTEAVTTLPHKQPNDDDFAQLKEHFTDNAMAEPPLGARRRAGQDYFAARHARHAREHASEIRGSFQRGLKTRSGDLSSSALR